MFWRITAHSLRAVALLSAALAATPVGAATPVAQSAGKSVPPPVNIRPQGPVPAAPSGGPAKILRLADVKPGMVGEAFTVFQGTKPEPFKVRVVSIMRQFLPKQDVILVRAEDPRVEFSGIVAGMSGSPVYVDGKLMGAIAYAWSFSKEPLGGVTPIETMLAERARPRRTGGTEQSVLDVHTDAEGLRVLTLAEGGPAGPATPDAGRPTDGGWANWGPRGQAASTAQPQAGSGSRPTPVGEPRLVPVAVPLSVSGFGKQALAELTRELEPMGLVPVQGGGGGARVGPTPSSPRRAARGRTSEPVLPGSAIGVELIRGDMSMVGTGTVTYVDGTGVLAFGHPMFGSGELYLPLVSSEIHAIVPSVAQSMKLSSPLREVGALVQDRQSCIVGDLGARATMVPVRVRVTGPRAATRTFEAEVARNRRLTPLLAATVASNALVDAEPDITDMVVTVVSNVTIKGRRPLELRDEIFAPEGISRLGLAGTRGLRVVGDLLSNPFEPVVLDRLELDVRIEYRRDVTEIVGLSLPGGGVRAGDTVPLRVLLRPYAGPEYTETVSVTIPHSVAGQQVRIEAASGGTTRPEMPPIESLSIYLDNLRRTFPPSSIVVSVQTPDEGAALRGRLLPDLPTVASDTLRPGSRTRRAEAYRVAARTAFPTEHLVFGKQEVSLLVRDDVLGARAP